MSNDGTTDTKKVWGLAAVAGVLAFLALKFIAGYAFWPALLLAVLVGVLVAILLWMGFFRDGDAASPMESSVPEVAAPPSPAAEDTATASEPEPEKPAPVAEPAKTNGKSDPKSTASALMGDAGAAMVSEKKSETKKTTAKAKPKRAPVAKDGKPPLLTKARDTGADDLKKIKGVGPALEKTLNELGFYHFDQIAGWRKKEIEWVDERLKFKGRIERDEWIKQAKALAKAAK